jgi:hypothetical protein
MVAHFDLAEPSDGGLGMFLLLLLPRLRRLLVVLGTGDGRPPDEEEVTEEVDGHRDREDDGGLRLD